MKLDEVRVRPLERDEEPLHRQLMVSHHYLGFLPKIGHTLWYIATYHEQWIALLIFSAAAWKCAVRDRWIGWDFHRQYDYDRLQSDRQQQPFFDSARLASTQSRLQDLVLVTKAAL